jgi:8-oxo-dGTP diphosphatase
MVDVVIPSDENRGVLLIRRGKDPYEGLWALPGSFVHVGETLEAAASRVAEKATGLKVEVCTS